MSHYKPYPAYKDSGVEWLGRVPEHWEVKAIRWLSPIQRGASPRPIDDPKYFDDEGEYGWVRIEDVTAADGVLMDTKQRLSSLGAGLSVKLQPGALFLSIAGSVGKPCVAGSKVCIHDGFVYFPMLRSHAEWLFKIFESRTPFIGLGKLGTQLNLNTETVGSIKVGLPPVCEALQTLSALNRETTRIDALVAKKTRFIELLREKRQALITHAVTKGLDPNVKMKDSGVEWLGEVPEHWSFGRLAYACELIVDGTHHSPESYPDGAFKYITAKNIKEHGFDFTELTYLSADQHQEIYSRCSVKAGDVLYIKDGATAGVAMVNCLDEEFSLLSSVAVIRPKKKRLLPEYLAYLLNSGGFKTSVLSQLVGGAITRFTLEMIGNFSVSLPSIEEQRQVVAYLERIVHRLDVLKGKTERSIALLKERRSALITAAVTGQIDLREAV